MIANYMCHELFGKFLPHKIDFNIRLIIYIFVIYEDFSLTI